MIGQSIPRKEDARLLTGGGRYLDDHTRPGLLHVGIVRSPHAHARVVRIAGEKALLSSGVIGVYSTAELPRLANPIPPYRTIRKFRVHAQPVLANAVVRYVGEPVAVVVAANVDALLMAMDGVEIEYDPLPGAASIAAALEPGAPIVHAGWPDNVAHVSRLSTGDPDSALRGASEIISERFSFARSAAMPIEPRGALAYIDDDGRLVVVASTQVTYHLREAIAEVLGLTQEQIRVIAPDVGGAFGAKAQIYPEEIIVPALALHLGVPVKWVETRSEHFIGTCHDREQVHDIRVGFRPDGTIIAIDDAFGADFGAYPVQEDGVTTATMYHLCSPYKLAHYRTVCSNVVTNKTFSAAVRGSGRPEAAFVMDRVLDIAARRLKIDPAEIRRRNLIRAAEMPYRPGLTYKDGVPIEYDPGDFHAAFERMLELLGYAEHRERQRQSARAVSRIGIGLSCYLHGSALGPYEGANVRVDPSGKVFVSLGCSSQGQGHATTLAQVCAEALSVAADDVVVIGADTQALPYGVGAIASRIAAIAGTAVARAAEEVRAKACKVAASMLEAAPEDIRLTAGRVHVVGVKDAGVPLAAVAKAAVKSKLLNNDPGLNATAYFAPRTVTWAFGAQAAIVEVDVETGATRILKYVAVHDCGRPINPMIIDGQLHGGIALGIGGALMERLHYDAAGQLQTGTFMDYTIPRADDLPSFVTELINHPSLMNELGIKGVGESGTICPAGVIANAIEDALSEFAITIRDAPVTSQRVFELLREAATRR